MTNVYQTTIEKSAYSGWYAETLIPMGFTIHDGDAYLSISTSKAIRGGISTCATVYGINKEQGTRTTEIFGDFRKQLETIRAKMANEKRVSEAHVLALQSADALLVEALAFYKIKEVA